MKSTLAAVKRQRFPSQASWRVSGLFILGLGTKYYQQVEIHIIVLLKNANSWYQSSILHSLKMPTEGTDIF